MPGRVLNLPRRLAVILGALILLGMGAPLVFSQSATESGVEPATIALTGPLASRNAEVSGLAWYGNWLVFLPQYPWFSGGGQTALYVLPQQEIADYLSGRRRVPLSPRPVQLDVGDVVAALPGFEGFESIAFVGDQFFVTVEADLGSAMQGWILRGEIAPDLSRARIDVESATPIPAQAAFQNMSDEAMIVHPTEKSIEILTFYEANGLLANRNSVVHRYAADLTPLPSLPMVNVEYRITDATALDAGGRFWVSNYFWPGEAQLLLGGSALGGRLRALLSRTNLHPVERLVELQVTSDGIQYTSTPPINLTLSEGDSRNWEGIVRFEDSGFLLVTDRFPETILAFVPRSGFD